MLLRGGLRIFKLFGVQVYLHWTWLLAALLLVNVQYSSKEAHTATFYILQLATIFLIVLLHEFGHALACKSVGGTAKEIVLTPLGGIAFAKPPARPGATLWTIAAGPLVNVILVPITALAAYLTAIFLPGPWAEFALNITFLNLMLLFFNLLPIYPLDGGQILHSLLWFAFGQWRSLFIASIIGIVGAAGLAALGLLAILLGTGGGIWPLLIAVFMGSQALGSLNFARLRLRIANTPRRSDAACPQCGAHPPLAALWQCRCKTKFDLFANWGVCPNCRLNHQQALCLECFKLSPTRAWYEVVRTQPETPPEPPRPPIVITLPPETPLPWRRPETQA